MSTESRELPELSKQLGYALVRVLQDDYEPIIEMARTLRITFPSGEPCVEALAHSRAQDSGGEAVISAAREVLDTELGVIGCLGSHSLAEHAIGKLSRAMSEHLNARRFAAEQPAKGKGRNLCCALASTFACRCNTFTPRLANGDGCNCASGRGSDHCPVHADRAWDNDIPQPSDPADAVLAQLLAFAESFRITVTDSYYSDAYLHITRPDKSVSYRLPTPSTMSPDLAMIEKMRVAAIDRAKQATPPTALAHSRAQDSGGEAADVDARPCYVCGLRADQHPWVDGPRGGKKRGPCPAAEHPAKGDVPLCEKYGDGCNFPDCPCDVDDPLTQQPFKGEGACRCTSSDPWDCIRTDDLAGLPCFCKCHTAAQQSSDPADDDFDVLYAAEPDSKQAIKGICRYWYERGRAVTPPTAHRHDVTHRDDGMVVMPESLMNELNEIGAAWKERAEKAEAALAAHGAGAAVEAVALTERQLRAVNAAMENAEHDAGDFDDADEDQANARDLYEGLQKLLKPTPSQQRSEQVATFPDGGTFEQYRALLATGSLTPVDQMAFDNALHDRLSEQVAGGGGVDSLPAELPNGIVQSLRLLQSPKAIRELWAALRPLLAALSTQPLLSDQPAGVSDEMVMRAHNAMWANEHPQSTDAIRDGLIAALHPEQAKDGAAG